MNVYNINDFKDLNWAYTNTVIPKSAKVMPCWIHTGCCKYDLVWLSEDEKYFISTDHKRVYPVKEIDCWTMVLVPC